MKQININPVVLIIINIIAPSMYIFMSGKYLQVYLFIFASILIVLMGRYKGLITFWIAYFGMLGLYYLTIRNEKTMFIALFLIVMAQATPCMALAVVLIRKYNSAQLLSALETMHIPRVIVVAVTITLKYIPTFKREFKYIRESMRLRGISFSYRHPIRSFQYFLVPQLFRCAAIAEEVTSAGLVKGIDVPVKRSSYFEQSIKVSDCVILFVFISGLAGGYLWMGM